MLQHEIVSNLLYVFSLLFVLQVDGARKGNCGSSFPPKLSLVVFQVLIREMELDHLV
jgi:hypothetical protein